MSDEPEEITWLGLLQFCSLLTDEMFERTGKKPEDASVPLYITYGQYKDLVRSKDYYDFHSPYPTDPNPDPFANTKGMFGMFYIMVREPPPLGAWIWPKKDSMLDSPVK